MKFIRLATIAAAVALFVTACNNTTNTTNTSNAGMQPSPAASPAQKPSAQPSPAGELASARETFSQKCAVCHGPNGEGGVVDVGKKKLKVPSLREGHALGHPDEKLARQVTNGGDGMPPFKAKLTPDQINDLVRFIRHDLQGGAAAPASAATPAAPKS